jgi:hypothetical protein
LTTEKTDKKTKLEKLAIWSRLPVSCMIMALTAMNRIRYTGTPPICLLMSPSGSWRSDAACFPSLPEENRVALMAEAVEKTAATRISTKPIFPKNHLRESYSLPGILKILLIA